MTTEIPSRWSSSTVGEVATLVRGVTFKKHETSRQPDIGLVPILRAGNVQDGRIRVDKDLIYVPAERVAPEQYLRSGDTLIATSSGSLSVVGKSALVTSDWTGAHGAFMAVLRPHPDIQPAYLSYWLQSDHVRGLWRGAAAGTNINNLKRNDLLSTSVPVLPLAEQDRIVAAIEEHFSRLDAVESALVDTHRRLDVLRGITMDRAFYDAEAERTFKIGDLAEVSGGIQKQPKRRPRENRYPFLRVANVGRGKLDLVEVHEVELFEGEIDRFRLKQGDLLVVEGNGSASQIGRAALWGGEIDDCVHQNHLIRVRPGDELLPEYLALCWNAPHTAQQVRAVASSTSGLYTLSTSKVKSVGIPLVPLSDQRRIVEQLGMQLSGIEQARVAACNAQARVLALRRAILAQAFVGKLALSGMSDASEAVS